MAHGRVLLTCILTAVITSSTAFFVLRHVAGRMTSGAESLVVPTVVGLTPDQARPLLEASGLLLVINDYRQGEPERAGQILSQHPLAGSAAKRGGVVQVSVAAGEATVRVPALKGLVVGTAVQVLDSVGLKPGRIQRQAAAGVRADLVLRSVPDEGLEVRRGDEVALWVAGPAQGLAVPQVVGKSLATARRLLQTAGFTVGQVRQRLDEDRMEGLVLSQKPGGGELASQGSAVDLVVNQSPY